MTTKTIRLGNPGGPEENVNIVDGSISTALVATPTTDIGDVTLLAGTALVGKVGIDQATANANEVVVKTNIHPPGLSTVACGELQGSATALQLPNVACKFVRFRAVLSNAGNVYVGGASVTKPDGTTDTTTGLELSAGEDTGWIPASNLSIFYRICDNAGDDLCYLAIS